MLNFSSAFASNPGPEAGLLATVPSDVCLAVNNDNTAVSGSETAADGFAAVLAMADLSAVQVATPAYNPSASPVCLPSLQPVQAAPALSEIFASSTSPSIADGSFDAVKPIEDTSLEEPETPEDKDKDPELSPGSDASAVSLADAQICLAGMLGQTLPLVLNLPAQEPARTVDTKCTEGTTKSARPDFSPRKLAAQIHGGSSSNTSGKEVDMPEKIGPTAVVIPSGESSPVSSRQFVASDYSPTPETRYSRAALVDTERSFTTTSANLDISLNAANQSSLPLVAESDQMFEAPSVTPENAAFTAGKISSYTPQSFGVLSTQGVDKSGDPVAAKGLADINRKNPSAADFVLTSEAATVTSAKQTMLVASAGISSARAPERNSVSVESPAPVSDESAGKADAIYDVADVGSRSDAESGRLETGRSAVASSMLVSARKELTLQISPSLTPETFDQRIGQTPGATSGEEAARKTLAPETSSFASGMSGQGGVILPSKHQEGSAQIAGQTPSVENPTGEDMLDNKKNSIQSNAIKGLKNANIEYGTTRALYQDAMHQGSSLTAGAIQATKSPDLPAPVSPAAASRLVEQVSDAAEKLSAGGNGKVDLRIELEGNHHVDVHVSVRGGRVHADFRSDSPEVRAALSSAWEGFVHSREGVAQRWADPVFSAPSGNNFVAPAASTSAAPDNGLAGSGQNHQRRENGGREQSAAAVFSGPSNRFGNRGSGGVSSSTVSESAARSDTSRHLSVLA